MTRATILVPTHAERPTLALSLQSALRQTVRDIEVIVVGDGCPGSTRDLVMQVAHEDERVRFFDLPKGERHGEAHRHAALERATGEVVTYLSDDDLLYPDHVEVALDTLKTANFMAPRACFVFPDGGVCNYDGDITRPWWQTILQSEKRNFIPLTGVAHTLKFYRQLSQGWSPAPADVWTDLFMWRKFIGHSAFLPAMAPHVTCLVFPTPSRASDPVERHRELAAWALGLTDERARNTVDRRLLVERHDKASDCRFHLDQHRAQLDAAPLETAELRGITQQQATRIGELHDALRELNAGKENLADELRRTTEACAVALADASARLTSLSQSEASLRAELTLLRRSLVWRARQALYQRAWVREPFLMLKRLL